MDEEEDIFNDLFDETIGLDLDACLDLDIPQKRSKPNIPATAPVSVQAGASSASVTTEMLPTPVRKLPSPATVPATMPATNGGYQNLHARPDPLPQLPVLTRAMPHNPWGAQQQLQLAQPAGKLIAPCTVSLPSVQLPTNAVRGAPPVPNGLCFPHAVPSLPCGDPYLSCRGLVTAPFCSFPTGHTSCQTPAQCAAPVPMEPTIHGNEVGGDATEPPPVAELFMGEKTCWGGVLQGTTRYCVPGFQAGQMHFKNKFCAACRSGMNLPIHRIRALSPDMHEALSNTSRLAGGFWKMAPPAFGGGQMRIINNTLKCSLPWLVCYQRDPPDCNWAPLPPQWISEDGHVRLCIAKGTLCPVPQSDVVESVGQAPEEVVRKQGVKR
eukprot:CAMPEP_0174696242 /NCGR_PEP_ID=MMETSP1094-20130205/2436_1 /TAXON_ID=156173 /ORGANISM="Chrysochromulina brevifilum, Strain UTEX LB 985" /LENGTH=380 /DNA_ID=CAMNT_0015892963 /DNA_START=60 /DNA_END=1199 /DNA_ORIENTATION=-